MSALDPLDRRIVAALQEGLPLEKEPWQAVARQTGMDAATVKARVEAMQQTGVIRRIAAVPNHYRLGLTANGMSVWDVDDRRVDALGARVGALPFVSHCYRRPRRLPDWPYNLFAMVHGASRQLVEAHVAEIAGLLGEAARGHDVLYSVRILKKTGLRIAA
jgi:siroheme decarboxylase